MALEARTGIGGSVCDQLIAAKVISVIASRRTEMLNIQPPKAPNINGSFYISFAKITLPGDFVPVPGSLEGYNVIAKQGVTFLSVWHFTCYTHKQVPAFWGA